MKIKHSRPYPQNSFQCGQWYFVKLYFTDFSSITMSSNPTQQVNTAKTSTSCVRTFVDSTQKRCYPSHAKISFDCRICHSRKRDGREFVGVIVKENRWMCCVDCWTSDLEIHTDNKWKTSEGLPTAISWYAVDRPVSWTSISWGHVAQFFLSCSIPVCINSTLLSGHPLFLHLITLC